MTEWLLAFQGCEWVLKQLAGADGDASTFDALGKIGGTLAMGIIGDAAKGGVRGLLAERELRPASEPMNHHIEQAYRLAELGSLVIFLSRPALKQLLPGDALAGPDAALTIQSLCSRHDAVRRDRQAALAQGIELDHLTAVLSSLSERQWEAADAQARALRWQVEQRALDDLEIASGRPPSPAFVQLFRQGGGEAMPPWFGVLAHSFMHVLLQQDKKKAQESLLLRLVSRTAMARHPQVDLDSLDQLLKDSVQAQLAAGTSLGDRIAATLDGLGTGLGSQLGTVRQELAAVAAEVADFRAAWTQGLADLTHTLDRIEQLIVRNHAAILAKLEAMERLLAQRAQAAGPPAAALADVPADASTAHPGAAQWAAAGLPAMPPADGRPLGRDAELAVVQAFLADAQQRLLCVHGRGGAGKTTLVSWAAAAMPGAASRPVIYLKLTEVHRRLGGTLLDALDRLLAATGAATVAADAHYPSFQSKLEEALRRLAARRVDLLLVIDSLEQAIVPADRRLADADLEATVLHAAGTAGSLQLVLCTQLMPWVPVDGMLQPLQAAAPQRLVELPLGSGLSGTSACLTLLRSLLAGARPDLADTPEAVWAPLFASVGGNPQAIKHIAIALAGDALLQPAALLASLAQPGSGPGAAQAVRDALIGRYLPRLDDAQRQLLLALAVLGGHATVDAITSVANIDTAGAPGAAAAARGALAVLLDMHLVQRAPGDAAAIHDTEKSCCLAAADPLQLRAAYRRAAAWWQRQAAAAPPWQSYGDALPALSALAMWVLAGDAPEAAALRLRSAQRLADIGLVVGAADLLAAATAAEQALDVELERLSLVASCHWKLGRYAPAQAACEAGLAHGRERRLPPTHAALLALRHTHAVCEMELGRAQQAVADCSRLLADLQAAALQGDAPADERAQHLALACRTGTYLAFAHSVAGAQPQALDAGQHALDLLATPDAQLLPPEQRQGLRVLALAYIGLVHSYCGHYPQARKAYREAARLAAAGPGLFERAIAYGHLAELDLIEGRIGLAVDHATESLLAEADTDAMSGSWCNWLIAMALALSSADLVQAQTRAQLACRYTRLLNAPNPRVLLGLLLLRQGSTAEGIHHLNQALSTVDRLTDACATNWEALVARGLALAALSACGQADLDEARQAYRAAHAASPHAGHFARIALQLKLAQPLLQDDGRELVDELAALYGAAG